MDNTQKRDETEQDRQRAADQLFREELLAALQAIARQNQSTENHAQRADTFHRRLEKLTLRLEGRKFKLEAAETVGLWVAAAVGVAAIIVSSIDSHIQTKVMRDQQEAMQGQLSEMKSTSLQTDQMIEANKKLAEAASQQALAAVDTVKAARDNLVANQRAWVGPRNGRSDGPPELGKDFSAFVDYHNSGREPGIETIYDVDLFTISEADDMAGKTRTRVMDFSSKCKIKWSPTDAQVVYPTTGGFVSAGYSLFKKITGDQIDQDVIDGTKILVINGCFVYKTSGTIHRSSFCYYFNTKISKPATWNICPFGNDAD